MPLPSVRTEYEKRLVALQQCLQTIQRQETKEGLGKVLLAFLKEWFQFDLIWIASYQTQTQTLAGIDGILPNKEKDQAYLHRQQPLLPGDLFDQTLVTGRPQEIPSLKQEQRAGDWQAIAQRQGIQGTLVLPIRYRQESLGILLVGTTLWGGHSRTEEMTEMKMLTGALGSALFTLEFSRTTAFNQPTQTPLIDMIGRILGASTAEEKVKLVLEQTHAIIAASRTCLYGVDVNAQTLKLEQIYTSSGTSLKRSGSKSVPSVEIALQDIALFYQSTLQNQMVAIADIQSAVSSHNVPTRLMKLIKSQSWLSVPVMQGDKLVGVLSVEGNEARLWSPEDKQYLQLMAQLMGQSGKECPHSSEWQFGSGSPSLDRLLNTLNTVEHTSGNWQKTLLYCLEQISVQFAVRWVAILEQSSEDKSFECRAQFFQKKKQPLPQRLPALSEVDAKLLRRLSSPIEIQSIDQDLRLLAWRDHLTTTGIQSYLFVAINPSQELGSFLLLGTDLPRTWTSSEADTTAPIAQVLSQALSRRDQWVKTTLQQQWIGVLNQGLHSIQKSRQVEQLFSVSAQALYAFLEVECLMILCWSSEEEVARIVGLVNHSKFQVDSTVPILWQTDGLVQSLLGCTTPMQGEVQDNLVTFQGKLADLSDPACQWLSGLGELTLLSMPLQIGPEETPLGIVLALDRHRRNWTLFQREGMQLLTHELTLHYRAHCTQQQLNQRLETLECLNWYKQRYLEQVCRLWTEQMSKFQALATAPVAGSATGLNGLRARHQQPITQLYEAFNVLDTILKTEVWELQLSPETISVATLLRRSLERIEEVVRSRQLWTQVHNLPTSVSLQVPAQKLELMIVELLLAACYRSKLGDRIDIWCRLLQETWIEISITDNGRLNPQLISAIADSAHHAVQSPNPILDVAPGLHFKVCQSLVEQLGGQFELVQLEDGRSLSRIILPLVQG